MSNCVVIPHSDPSNMQFISLNHALLSSSLYPSTMYCCHPVYIPQLYTIVIHFISLNYVLFSSSLSSSNMNSCHPIHTLLPSPSTMFVVDSSMYSFYIHLSIIQFMSSNLNSVTWIQIHSQHSIDNLK